MLSTHLMIGEITRPQGIRGEVKVRPATCDPDRFYDMDHVFFKRGDAYVEQKIHVNRVEPDAVYMTFDGVNDRTQAEKLRGEFLYIDREHSVELPENANFICDLIGCQAVDTEGRSWGELKDVLQPGGCDVYVFRREDGRELMVPALKKVVLQVRPSERHILLDAQGVRETGVTDDTETV